MLQFANYNLSNIFEKILFILIMELLVQFVLELGIGVDTVLDLEIRERQSVVLVVGDVQLDGFVANVFLYFYLLF